MPYAFKDATGDKWYQDPDGSDNYRYATSQKVANGIFERAGSGSMEVTKFDVERIYGPLSPRPSKPSHPVSLSPSEADALSKLLSIGISAGALDALNLWGLYRRLPRSNAFPSVCFSSVAKVSSS